MALIVQVLSLSLLKRRAPEANGACPGERCQGS